MTTRPTDQRHASEEVRDIIDRMPTHWAFVVAAVVTAVVATAAALSFAISYPDTVSGQIAITAENAPVRMVSPSSGRIVFLRDNLANVKSGDHLAYIENGAKYDDFLRLLELCERGIPADSMLSLPQQPKLGQLSTAYHAFALAYHQYWLARQSKAYDNMRKALVTQMEADQSLGRGVERNIALGKDIAAMAVSQYTADSTLWAEGGLSQEGLRSSRSNVLAQRRMMEELSNSRLSKEADIRKEEVELARVAITEQDELAKLYREMHTSFDALCGQVLVWREQYLVTAPTDGRMEMLGFLRDNDFVQQTQELFAVIPASGNRMGELRIPAYGAGKVSVGQTVNVKLNDYPYDRYGMVKGVVASISSSPKHEDTEAGQIDAYLVTVAFPRGLVTNFGQALGVNLGAHGTADIVTKDKRLIERLFDNLRTMGEK